MPLSEETPDLAELRAQLLAKILKRDGADGAKLYSAEPRISEAASHDFTSYEFLYEPLVATADETAFARQELNLFYEAIRAALAEAMPYDFYITVAGSGSQSQVGPQQGRLERGTYTRPSDRALALQYLRAIFKPHILPAITARVAETEPATRSAWLAALAMSFAEELARTIRVLVENLGGSARSTLPDQTLSEDIRIWERVTDIAFRLADARVDTSPLSDNRTRTTGHSVFSPFEEDTVNFGLQLVYRQVWKPLGSQSGEIVRTIPLGPGQSEKVTIKSVRRSRVAQSRTTETEQSSTNEASASTKDSSEVVAEASQSFNWNVEANASANWGWGQAGISAGMGGDRASSSRDTKSNLSEAMSKSADKLRVSTKVNISTEISEELERSQTSEIKNDNDEIAVTYVYSKLQRQYEIYTYLAEINTVVFVAAGVPHIADMDQAWFDRHAHALAAALLSPGLVGDLERVLGYDEYGEGLDAIDPKISAIVGKIATNGLPVVETAPGTPPDQISGVIATYESQRQRVEARLEDRQRYRRSLRRLQEHIAENALHYGRAIWEAEDPGHRNIRFRNIRVPTRWSFREGVSATYYGDTEKPVAGYLPTEENDDNWPRLTDLINPAGPIGYAGNYLTYYLRSGSHAIADLAAPLAALRLPFLGRSLRFDVPEGMEVQTVISPAFLPSNHVTPITLSITEADAEGMLTVTATVPLEEGETVTEAAVAANGGVVRLKIRTTNGYERDFLKVRLSPNSETLANATILGQLVLLPDLEDPELMQQRFDLGPLDISGDRPFASTAALDAMAASDPEVAQIKAAAGGSWDAWSEIAPEDRLHIAAVYPEYIHKQAHTRRFLLDTDNVLLTRIVDDASTLEPFKGLHRYLDVLSTIETLSQAQLETLRLQARLNAEILSDPDVETRTVLVGDADPDINV